MTIAPTILSVLGIAPQPAPEDNTQPVRAVQEPLFKSESERKVAEAAYEMMHRSYSRLMRSSELTSPDVQQKMVASLMEEIRPLQGELSGIVEPVDIADVVRKTTEAFIERTIFNPKIAVVPSGDVTVGYHDFDLDCSSVHYPPVAKDLLIQRLTDNQRFRLVSGDGVVEEPRLENYIVRGLVDKNDIDCSDKIPRQR
jgi:type III restriction enzyme